MNKNLYKGTFNWYGEKYIIYRYASNKMQAYILMIIRLKGGLQRTYASVHNFFKNTDRYKIEEVRDDIV